MNELEFTQLAATWMQQAIDANPDLPFRYRHIIPINKEKLLCNHNLFDVDARSGDDEVLNGILNSSLAILSKQIYGRPVGVEGNQKTEVIDVKMMLVPDVRKAGDADKKRIKEAMSLLQQRRPKNLISPREFNRTKWEQKNEPQKLAALSDESELDLEDRRKLDDAVLRMLGFGDEKERKSLLSDLYAYLESHFIQVRRKEEKANVNKKKNKKKGRSSAGALAQSVIDQLRREAPEVFRRYPQHFIDPRVVAAAVVDTFEIPSGGKAELIPHLMFGHVVEVKAGGRARVELRPSSQEQAELLTALIREGIHGLVVVPHDAELCIRVKDQFLEWVRIRDEVLDRIIEQKMPDEHMRERVRKTVIPAISGGEAVEDSLKAIQ